MSSTQGVLVAAPQFSIKGASRPPSHRSFHAVETRWAIAFIAPYAAVFLAFIAFPFLYALWMAGRPELYAELVSDPLYLPTVVNTLVFAGLGVNLTMFLALLLSGFFIRRRWWIKALLAAYLLPWLIAAAEGCVSIHWMLIHHWGLIDLVLASAFGVNGPAWLDYRWTALACDIAAYAWKWMPFWTVIFICGRLMIAQDIYDAAEVDGATGVRRFFHVTFPLLANLYLICTLLFVLWTLGDFITVYLVSSGGPALSTEVLATLGFHYAFDIAKPALGVAATMSTLPILIPVLIVLIRRLQTREVLQ